MALQNKFSDDKFRKQRQEELRQRAAGTSGLGYIKGDASVFKPKVGKSITRFMDATWPSATYYGYNVWVHYGIGPNNASVLCLRLINKACPVCEEVEKARRNQDDDFAASYSAKPRVLAYLVDRENEDKGPQIWPMPKRVDQDLALAAEDETTKEILFIDDPENGYDVVINKEVPGGVQKNTRYAVKLARQASKLSSNAELAKQWLKYTAKYPIPDVLKFETAERIKEMLSGGQSGDDSDEVESETSVKREVLDEENTASANGTLNEASVLQMKRKELIELIKQHELSVDADNFDSTQDLAEQIVMELGLA